MTAGTLTARWMGQLDKATYDRNDRAEAPAAPISRG
jgi:hypothetical protein